MKPVKLYYFLIPQKNQRSLRDPVESTTEEESKSEHTRRR